MAHPGHSVTKCQFCRVVMGQCRCMEPNKPTVWVVCEDCRKREARDGDLSNEAPPAHVLAAGVAGPPPCYETSSADEVRRDLQEALEKTSANMRREYRGLIRSTLQAILGDGDNVGSSTWRRLRQILECMPPGHPEAAGPLSPVVTIPEKDRRPGALVAESVIRAACSGRGRVWVSHVKVSPTDLADLLAYWKATYTVHDVLADGTLETVISARRIHVSAWSGDQ